MLLLVLVLAAPVRAVGPGRLSQVLQVPNFKAAVLSQVSLARSLSVREVPTLSPIIGEQATPFDREAALLVGALAAQPEALGAHREELLRTLGPENVENLEAAARGFRRHADRSPEFRAQLDRLSARFSLADAKSLEELGARLGVSFDNSRVPSSGAVARRDSIGPEFYSLDRAAEAFVSSRLAPPSPAPTVKVQKPHRSIFSRLSGTSYEKTDAWMYPVMDSVAFVLLVACLLGLAAMAGAFLWLWLESLIVPVLVFVSEHFLQTIIVALFALPIVAWMMEGPW